MSQECGRHAAAGARANDHGVGRKAAIGRRRRQRERRQAVRHVRPGAGIAERIPERAAARAVVGAVCAEEREPGEGVERRPQQADAAELEQSPLALGAVEIGEAARAAGQQEPGSRAAQQREYSRQAPAFVRRQRGQRGGGDLGRDRPIAVRRDDRLDDCG